jgi:ABC-type multidrug transport system ATPase subunit
MSERLLKALMELFALISEVELNDDGSVRSTGSGRGREVVLEFLKKQLAHEQVEEYIRLFDEYLQTHHGSSGKSEKKRKRTSVNSVKVLKICTQINEELAQKQKMIVLLRILEFINADVVTEQELEFAITVAETFNITREEFDDLRVFVESKGGAGVDSPNLLVINGLSEEEFRSAYPQAKHINVSGGDGDIRVLRVLSVGLYFLRYFGEQDMFLNGQVISNDRTYVLTHGSSMRSTSMKPVYHSDIVARFMSDSVSEKIVFKAQNIIYQFKNGGIGLHPMDIIEESGTLFGIMGGSGAGKSTLLNVLNGNYKPTQGKVTINGIVTHSSEAKEKMEGVIGYVSQDDLLIEELTVFQNLYFNAKLCFGDKSNAEIRTMVEKLLADLGLSETRNLKVGSPLQKTISGGQRKRVNIGLELIREPAVLFVDEPTSGLSSRDSQNIMDLMKELTLKGKLIFVVIHQPSSDIFKMFDKLLILDKGGYVVYNGNPVDGIEYFKTLANYANAAGDTSGNVNPEEIFDIIDSKVVDEYGNLTENRKVSPKEWYETYKEKIGSHIENIPDPEEPPKVDFKIPNVFKQFSVFMKRDILSKLTNTQYMLINMIEAPALAAILAFFVKYYKQEFEHSEFVYRLNENLPQFLFISVVVALFIGLTVSAEEIIKDQKILKREKFLNLSKITYLNSKIVIMFLISAVQMLLYAVVGNLILEVKDMTISYWIVLFSVSCFANVLGLNISATFNSAKVIYILIPILIIPQLLFSGVIVKFDRLNPSFSSESGVPLIGNVMASRWAYEAMAVTTFKDNAYEREVFEYEVAKKYSTWKKDQWLGKLKEFKDYVVNNYEVDTAREMIDHNLEVLRNEIAKEEAFIENLQCKCTDKLYYDKIIDPEEKTIDRGVIKSLEQYMDKLKRHYRRVIETNNKLYEKRIKEMQEEYGKEGFIELMDEHTNQSLADFVTNRNSLDKIVEYEGELIQKSTPIYTIPYNKGFFESHFYAPRKFLFGKELDTFTANMMVIWAMTLLLIITLYFDAMKRALDGIGKLTALMTPKKKRR